MSFVVATCVVLTAFFSCLIKSTQIITWEDSRAGTFIYTQRVLSATGASDWTPNGISISSLAGYFPEICGDGAGGAIITFTTSDIYAQKLNSTGHLKWTPNGIAVCSASNTQLEPMLISDGAGGAIIAWDDERTGAANDDIYAQKILGNPPSDWLLTLISFAVLASYGGLIEDITKMIEGVLSILLSPIVMGSIILGEALVIVILSSIVKKSGTSGKSKKAEKR